MATRNINTTTANIINRTESCTAFLADARKYPILTADEENALIARIKSGDDNARKELVNHNLRFIFSLASCFAKDGNEIMELCSVATIGAYKAMDKFEPKRGFRFLSFAVHSMREEISEYFRTDARFIRKGIDYRVATKANKVSEKFYATEGRIPTEDEIIDILENEYNMEITSRVGIIGTRIDSIDANVGEDGDTAGEIGEIAMCSASRNEYEGEIESEQKRRTCNLFLSTLRPQEENVLRLAFGLGEDGIEYDDEAIALKYGMTSERIRQIKIGALAKLKERKKRVLAAI